VWYGAMDGVRRPEAVGEWEVYLFVHHLEHWDGDVDMLISV
jgi:hypothetical protein